jgi:hypothetical protein
MSAKLIFNCKRINFKDIKNRFYKEKSSFIFPQEVEAKAPPNIGLTFVCNFVKCLLIRY